MVKEECPPHRIDCPLGSKSGGSTRAEEKPIRDTAYRLRGKGLDMPCDSYCGWLSWFSRTLSHFLSKIGITGRSLKVASNRLQTAAQYASSWIWLKAKSFQHEWNARKTTIPVWLRNLKKRLPKVNAFLKITNCKLKMKMNVLCNLCFNWSGVCIYI